MMMDNPPYLIPFADKTIETTVTDTAFEIDQWLSKIGRIHRGQQGSNLIVGLDIEWKPNRSSSDDNITATLQLCVDTNCLIVKLCYLDSIPRSLRYFLNDPNVTFVGVKVQSDVEKLREDHGLVCANTVDIGRVARERWPGRFAQTPGLKSIVLEVVGVNMSKPKSVQLSNWQASVLNYEQVKYACIDAYASYIIGHTLLR